MFPNFQDSPAHLAQGFSDGNVPFLIANNFLQPIAAVRIWLSAMNRAAMPEASVNKQNDSLLSESEIRFARYFLIPSPAGNSIGTKN